MYINSSENSPQRHLRHKKPPLCKLPGGFHLPNVYPSGTISLSTLNEEEGWRPDFSIPELMFDIQQLLAHPNMNSPAQSKAYLCYKDDKVEYLGMIKSQSSWLSYIRQRTSQREQTTIVAPNGF